MTMAQAQIAQIQSQLQQPDMDFMAQFAAMISANRTSAAAWGVGVVAETSAPKWGAAAAAPSATTPWPTTAIIAPTAVVGIKSAAVAIAPLPPTVPSSAFKTISSSVDRASAAAAFAAPSSTTTDPFARPIFASGDIGRSGDAAAVGFFRSAYERRPQQQHHHEIRTTTPAATSTSTSSAAASSEMNDPLIRKSAASAAADVERRRRALAAALEPSSAIPSVRPARTRIYANAKANAASSFSQLKAETKIAVSSAVGAPAAAAAADDPAVIERDPHQIDRPKRPLSAYNYFFQHERARLVALSERGERLEDHPPMGLDLHGVRLLLAQSSSASASAASSSADGNADADGAGAGAGMRNRHGRVGFTDLVKYMSASWKKVDRQTRAVFEEISDVDKARYKREMRAYRVKINAIKNLNKKRKREDDGDDEKDGGAGKKKKTYSSLEEKLRAEKRAKMEAAAEKKKKTKEEADAAASVEQLLRKKEALSAAVDLLGGDDASAAMPFAPLKPPPRLPRAEHRRKTATAAAEIPRVSSSESFVDSPASVSRRDVESSEPAPLRSGSPLRVAASSAAGVNVVAASSVEMTSLLSGHSDAEERGEMFDFLNALDWNAH